MEDLKKADKAAKEYLIHIYQYELYIMPSGDFARKIAKENGRSYDIIEDKESQGWFVKIYENLEDETLGYFKKEEDAEEAVREDATKFLNGVDDYVGSYNCPLEAAAGIPYYIEDLAQFTNGKLSNDATESEFAFYLSELLEQVEAEKE